MNAQSFRRSPTYRVLLGAVAVLATVGMVIVHRDAVDAAVPSWFIETAAVTLPPLMQADGTPVHLPPAKNGRIVHWAEAWCGHCVRELPSFIEASRTWQQDGVQVIIVSTTDLPLDAAAVAPVATVVRLHAEPDGPLATSGVPATWILDGGNRLVGRIIGAQEWTPALTAAVSQRARDPQPLPATARTATAPTLNCSHCAPHSH